MEFGFRAGDNRPPSLLHPPTPSSISDPFFTLHPMRATDADRLPEPATAEEALQREMQKEQIRKEMLREMAQRRLIAEEVRRELEIEHALAFRRMHWRGPEVGVEGRRGGERGGGRGQDNACDDAAALSVVTASDGATADGPLSACTAGTKRKAGFINGLAKLLRSSKKDWSCALCQVSATSREGLDEHLNGKKHKAKEALLNVKKAPVEIDGVSVSVQTITWSCSLCRICTTSEKTLNDHLEGRKHKAKEALLAFQKTRAEIDAGSTGMPNEPNKHMVENNTEDSMLNADVVSSNQEKSSATTVQMTQNKTETKGKKKKKRKRNKIWCQVCKLKCNSKSMLVAHLGGRKHKNRMAEIKSGVDESAARVTTLDAQNAAVGAAEVITQMIDEKTNELIKEGKGESTINGEERDGQGVSIASVEQIVVSTDDEEIVGKSGQVGRMQTDVIEEPKSKPTCNPFEVTNATGVHSDKSTMEEETVEKLEQVGIQTDAIEEPKSEPMSNLCEVPNLTIKQNQKNTKIEVIVGIMHTDAIEEPKTRLTCNPQQVSNSTAEHSDKSLMREETVGQLEQIGVQTDAIDKRKSEPTFNVREVSNTIVEQNEQSTNIEEIVGGSAQVDGMLLDATAAPEFQKSESIG